MSDNDPLSMRAARMKIYTRFMQELDSSGAHYSADISDVDLSDPDDVKATVTDPHGAVLVHLGSSNFLEHFQVYVTHVQEWRTQFQKLKSVDLRYRPPGDRESGFGQRNGEAAPATARRGSIAEASRRLSTRRQPARS